jgi:hypothetical protein
MSQVDFAIENYSDLKAEIDEHQQKEPIGIEYDSEDTHYWTMLFNNISDEFKVAEYKLKELLDAQLDDYMNQHTPPWNKRVSCLLLNERVGIHFSASINDLFFYLGRSVMGIPAYYKNKVINDFAHSLDDLANVDINIIREAIRNIGFKMEEACYNCNELMPTFEGSGHPICPDCA